MGVVKRWEGPGCLVVACGMQNDKLFVKLVCIALIIHCMCEFVLTIWRLFGVKQKLAVNNLKQLEIGYFHPGIPRQENF